MPNIKNWRPAGWRNPHKSLEMVDASRRLVKTDTYDFVEMAFSQALEGAFEAGADAMFKALIEKGEHFPGKFKAINFPTEMPAGTFIYIPDEEESYAQSKV